MTRKRRARWPIGPMADSLQPSSAPTHINDQVSPDPNSSSPQSNDNNTDLSSDSLIQPTMTKRRGPAWPIKEWGTGIKIDIELNRHNQPIGKNASKLASQLGVLARNGTFCPITYKDWRCKHLHQFKERIWKDVEDNCNVSKSYKKNCLKSVGKSWRNWKDVLKEKHYTIFDNHEERLANVPERVEADQWKLFVQYCGTDEAKERSEINQENQKKRVMSHTSGRKSHAVVRAEMTVDGKEPDRIEVYFKTHTRNGTPVDQAAAEAMDAIRERLEEVPEALHMPKFREKVFTDVLGCDTHGRVRTHGLGLSPTEIFGKKNNQSDEQYVHDLESAREEGRQKRDKFFIAKFEHLERYCVGLEDKILNIDNTIPKSQAKQDVQQVSDAESSHRLPEDLDPVDPSFETGTLVHFLNVDTTKKIVAEGIIVSKNPHYKLDGVQLGAGFWVVRISKAILAHETLLICRCNIRTVGQAFQKKESIFWRSTDIKRI